MASVKVAVTGSGSLLAQGIIRALKRSELEIHTIGAGIGPYCTGMHWTDEKYLVSEAKSPDYIESIRGLLEKTRPDILMVGTDVELAPLAKNKNALEQDFGVKILVSPPDVVAIADDKFATAEFFLNNNFAAPASAIASDKRGIEKIIQSCGFPLIVKPRVGARSYGVVRVENESELWQAVSDEPNAVVQELVGIDGDEFTAGCLCFDGSCDAVIIMRRDLRDGNTFRAFSVLDSDLEKTVKLWAEALQPYGPANFQFKIGADGVPRAFEINARFSGTTPLRMYAGFHEVDMCIRKLLWNEDIIQPVIEDITALRNWSETVYDTQTGKLIFDGS